MTRMRPSASRPIDGGGVAELNSNSGACFLERAGSLLVFDLAF